MKNNYKRLINIVSSFDGSKILVIGDLVLDRFWFGNVQRISREAPVPIVKLVKTSLLPGCCANSASNIASLNGIPILVGIVGEDAEGVELLKILEDLGATTKFVLQEKGWKTPTKTRILAGTSHGPKQQLVRVDSGENPSFKKQSVEKIKESLKRAIKETDFVVISDYGYGLCESFDLLSFLKGKVVAVDSRFNLDSFSGATTATPNEEEFEKAIGKEIPKEPEQFYKAGENLRRSLNLEALLVTRGSKGMALFERNRKPLEIEIVGKDEVVDVTGAGDTVISAYILSLSKGADFAESANIANVAGGMVVQKPGTATVSQEELIKQIELWGKGKI